MKAFFCVDFFSDFRYFLLYISSSFIKKYIHLVYQNLFYIYSIFGQNMHKGKNFL